MENNDALNTLHEIRNMMVRSSRFQSISGWSVLVVGILASIVSAGAWLMLIPHPQYAWLPDNLNGVMINSPHRTQVACGIALALLVVCFAIVSFGAYRTISKKQPFTFDQTLRRVLFHFCIPMLVGGLLCLAMLLQGHYGLTSTLMLVFYGLSLLNASHYTHPSIAVLAYVELLLGIIDCFVVTHAILFWFLGFGLVHILFGIYILVSFPKKEN